MNDYEDKFQVVMTVSDRPDYLKKTLESWSKVRGIQDQTFIFHIEPARVEENRRVVIDFVQQVKAAGVLMIRNKVKLGVLVNPWNALDYSFQHGAAYTLLCEEDTPVSSDILEYHKWAASEYRDDQDVLGICSWWGGYYDSKVDNLCMLRDDFNPLVWGTWSDRWYDLLRDTWDKDYSSGLSDGSQAGWDWNIKRVKAEKRFLFPLQSRSDHIGEVGVHMRPQDFQQSVAQSFVLDRPQTKYHEV